MNGIRAAVLMGLVVAATGCSKDEAPAGAAEGEAVAAAEGEAEEAAPEETAALVVLTEEELGRVDEITATLNNGYFNSSVRTKDNANIFLSFVETSDDVSIVAASLKALSTTWTHSARNTERAQLITPAYNTIVLSKLRDENGVVQAAAIDAAEKSIKADSPDTEIIAVLVDLASNHATPAGRLAALGALRNSSSINGSAEQFAPFIAALDADEAWLVSGALSELQWIGRNAPDQPAYRAKLNELLSHSDPGVRGRAAQALASTVGARDAARDATGEAIMALLEDENNFTKSVAARALASLDYRQGIHAIMPLISNNERNTYDIEGFQELDGSTGRIHHDGSAWSIVSDATLGALKTYSNRVGERMEWRISYQTKDADIAAAIVATTAWYESVKAELPAAE